MGKEQFLSSFFCLVERSSDETGGPPGCGHAVHPGGGLTLSAGPTRLLPTVLPQSQGESAHQGGVED